MLKIIVLLLTLCCQTAWAANTGSPQMNRLRELFENIIGGTNYRHEHNYCRNIKNLNKDAVSCEIYQSFNNNGNIHSELATRFDLETISPNEEPPVNPPAQQKKINNFNVKIWYDKAYIGPRLPEILITTHIIRLTPRLKLTITCWEHHKCYAEQFINQLNSNTLMKINGEK